jgi:beta-galactosidase
MLKKIYQFLLLKKVFLVITILILPIDIVNATQSKELLHKPKGTLSITKDQHVYQSPYSFDETINRIENTLKEKGITIFARLKFSEDAKKAGLTMADEELLIFGDPKAGTLLMQEDPTIGFELPLKILVWRSKDTTNVGYIVPSMMAKRYAINKSQMIINKMNHLLENIVTTSLHS